MKLLYIDTETTGLDPVKQDVIQIAGIIEIDGVVKEEFELKCRPYSYEDISAEALATHGIALDTIKTFEHPQDVLHKVTAIFGKHVNKYDKADKFIAVGQNVGFDLDFMRAWFKKGGDNYFGSWIGYQKLDLLAASMLLQMAGVTTKTENFKLSTICNSLGIELKAHDALADIRATRAALQHYLGLIRREQK